MFTGNEILYIRNERIIVNELFPARRKAYELGLALNVRGITMEDERVKLLSQVVHDFLNQPHPTWKAIIQALRSQYVKCEELAQRIEERFCCESQKQPLKGD